MSCDKILPDMINSFPIFIFISITIPQFANAEIFRSVVQTQPQFSYFFSFHEFISNSKT